MNIATCNSCKADILWVKTVNGKSMPLDATPVVNGNIYLDEIGRAVYLGKGEDATGKTLYVSHFSSCPQAQKWRKS
jgi:hypothetical protein